MKDGRTTSRNILFTAMTVGLVLVVLEALLQGFYFLTVGDFIFRRALPPIYEEDRTRCYRVKAGLDYVHRTNEFEIKLFTDSQGLRTGADHRGISIDKDKETYRILVTGPSFAFGWGADYEEIFPTLIESGLEVPGRRIEIMNLGTPSQGPAHQLCWLQEVGHRYDPDMVVHTSYGREVSPRATQCPEDLECPQIENGQLVPPDAGLARRIKGVVKRSGLAFYGYYLYNALVQPDATVDESKSLHQLSEATSSTSSDVADIAESYRGYADFVRSVLGQDTPVAFIYIPYSYLVHPEDVGRFVDVQADDVQPARQRVAEGIAALESRGVQVLDTLPPLIEAAEKERLYYWLDIHFTPAGNKVVAEAAIPFLEQIILRDLARHEAKEVIGARVR